MFMSWSIALFANPKVSMNREVHNYSQGDLQILKCGYRIVLCVGL